MQSYPQLEITSRAAWRNWLKQHHTQIASIWLITYKKSSPDKMLAMLHVPYADVVEEALCFGWVDSLPRKLDADRSMLLLSPRRAGSPWSGLNKRRVAHLIETGQMTPAGQAKITAAKADGSWSVYDTAESLETPPDLIAALQAAGQIAHAHFHAFSPSARKGILWWIASAKQPATRARRITETARLAKLNLRANFPESKGK